MGRGAIFFKISSKVGEGTAYMGVESMKTGLEMKRMPGGDNGVGVGLWASGDLRPWAPTAELVCNEGLLSGCRLPTIDTSRPTRRGESTRRIQATA